LNHNLYVLDARERAKRYAPSIGSELQRIPEQVVYHLEQAVKIAADDPCMRCSLKLEGHTSFRGCKFKALPSFCQHQPQIDRTGRDREAAGFHDGYIQKVADEPVHVMCCAFDEFDIVAARFVLARESNSSGGAHDDLDKIAQIVRDDGKELVTALGRMFRSLPGRVL
jgi:hypothetical protein